MPEFNLLLCMPLCMLCWLFRLLELRSIRQLLPPPTLQPATGPLPYRQPEQQQVSHGKVAAVPCKHLVQHCAQVGREALALAARNGHHAVRCTVSGSGAACLTTLA